MEVAWVWPGLIANGTWRELLAGTVPLHQKAKVRSMKSWVEEKMNSN